MPLQATSGAASYDAFGGGVPVVPNYIEDVFSTYLYTGNGSTQTITNGIDLSGKGGMMWLARRDSAFDPRIWDTVRGRAYSVATDLTAAQTTDPAGYGLTSFNTDGFSVGPASSTAPNLNAASYASWTFREQAKFFDVVTWSGNGVAGRTISHSLGSVPGCIIVKKTNSASSSDWVVYHRSLGATKAMILNLTDSVYTWSVWNDTAPTSTVFSLNDASEVNGAGNSYVAYLFAHNAGGFGLTGTDNVISCGSYTGNGASTGPTVNLGYEPQWLMVKASSSDPGYPSNRWTIIDNMRGWPSGPNANSQWLMANTSDSEQSGGGQVANMTSTGFTVGAERNDSGVTFIYIAIRRGPMKVPTVGTSVFNALSRTGTAATATVSTTILPDLVMSQARGGMYNVFYDRLRGAGATLSPNLGTDAESVVANGITAFNNTSYTVGTDASQNRINWNTYTYANWLFSRAPSFFDEVCYTGNGTSGQTYTHNLGVAPNFIIIKPRSGSGGWDVAHSGNGVTAQVGGNLNTDLQLYPDTNLAAYFNSSYFIPTNINGSYNTSATTYVAYLFATCAGVSKVFSFTGTGSLQTINCGFTSGARFVLVKRTDSTGDWYVWDSARGISSSTDPYLLLNSTAAEVTSTNWVDTTSTGFQVTAASGNNVNINGATYIGLAIA
jgi:hypothetical protein